MLDRSREPEFARGNVLDASGVTATIVEMPRDATANAAWAFREFWRTGDEACLTRALAENFAAHPGSERGRQLQPSDEESK